MLQELPNNCDWRNPCKPTNSQNSSQKKESRDKLNREFLKVPDLSMGLYFLPSGGVDSQLPHTEGEVYYVVSGRAQIQVADAEGDR